MNKDLILLLELSIRAHGIEGTFKLLSEAVRNTAEKPILLDPMPSEPVYHLPMNKEAFNRIADELTNFGEVMEHLFLGEGRPCTKRPEFKDRIAKAQEKVDHWYPVNDLIGEHYDLVTETLIQTYQAKVTNRKDLVIVIVIHDKYKTLINICTEQATL